jgi:hypothetical protein
VSLTRKCLPEAKEEQSLIVRIKRIRGQVDGIERSLSLRDYAEEPTAWNAAGSSGCGDLLRRN